MSISQLRGTAYAYIREQISHLHGYSDNNSHSPVIPLHELMMLKEGLADPSAELISSLKQLLRGYVTEAEIDTHLAVPFQQYKLDKAEVNS